MIQLDSVLKPIENHNSSESEIIGFSEEDRPLTVTYHGRNIKSSLRVFIIAGQHGDERYGRKAIDRFITYMTDGKLNFPLMQFAILSNANPDGASVRKRENAQGIDLNRDHQRLDSKENRCVHSFVRRWNPHMIIDVHNYPSKRKHLLEKDIMLYYDVLVDVPTNPAAYCIKEKSKAEFIKNIRSDLRSHNINCERYFIVKPSGRVRHGSPDIVDARNSLSLRYNTLTFLVEGRTSTRGEDKSYREHLVSSQCEAIASILRWTQTQRSSLMENQNSIPKKGDNVAISSRYVGATQPFEISFKNLQTRKLDVVSLVKYTPSIKVTKYATLPTCYAIPSGKSKVIEMLHRHGFVSALSDSHKFENIQYYSIQSVKYSTRENRAPRKITMLTKSEQRRLDKFFIFPTSQRGGHSLAVFLEPDSKYGLHRYADLDLPIIPDSHYHILRIM
ncbi:MAG: M14 family zinc carboxypeptidase [Nitrosopumilaceae archaeon]